jgi:hypothetical protein
MLAVSLALLAGIGVGAACSRRLGYDRRTKPARPLESPAELPAAPQVPEADMSLLSSYLIDSSGEVSLLV